MPLTSDATRGTGLAVAVDLINTWDELEADPELIGGLADVRVWLDWHGLHEAAKRLRSDDVDRVRELRSRFARLFDVEAEVEAARLLNELGLEYGTPPRLERSGGSWRVRSWPDERLGLPAAAAYATAGLMEAFRELGLQRFGRCAGTPCRCAFVDRSPNKARRYCCSLCADRIAQALYRARRKEGAPHLLS